LSVNACFQPLKGFLSDQMNEKKTRVCKLPEEKFDFLGYTGCVGLTPSMLAGLLEVMSDDILRRM
jgi:hypothetical protein